MRNARLAAAGLLLFSCAGCALDPTSSDVVCSTPSTETALGDYWVEDGDHCLQSTALLTLVAGDPGITADVVRWSVYDTDGDVLLGTQTAPVSVGDPFPTNAALLFSFAHAEVRVEVEALSAGAVVASGETTQALVDDPAQLTVLLSLP